jgi:hypothetical protein
MLAETRKILPRDDQGGRGWRRARLRLVADAAVFPDARGGAVRGAKARSVIPL